MKALVRRTYRALALADGMAGVHRGMTALTREEWRAHSLIRLRRAMRIADAAERRRER